MGDLQIDIMSRGQHEIHIQYYITKQMLIPNNRNQHLPYTHLPYTPNKLNFYLAQCNKKNQKDLPNGSSNYSIHSSNVRVNATDRQNGLSLNGRDQRFKSKYQYSLPSNHILQSDYNQMANFRQPGQQFFNINDNSSFVSIMPINRTGDPKTDFSPKLHNDSLDILITDRQNLQIQSPKQSLRKTDKSQFNNSGIYDDFQCIPNQNCQSRKSKMGDRNKQNIFSQDYCYSLIDRMRPKNIGSHNDKSIPQSSSMQYYNYNNNSDQNIPKKKVNWKGDPKRISRRSTIKQKLSESFKQIAEHLSNISFQLNRNTKKLNQINKIYNSVKKQNPQEIIKRANLKYAAIDANMEKYNRRRPHVEYEDKVYKDPRYLIWQPLHPTTNN